MKKAALKASTVATLLEMDTQRKRRSFNIQRILESHETLREALELAREDLRRLGSWDVEAKIKKLVGEP